MALLKLKSSTAVLLLILLGIFLLYRTYTAPKITRNGEKLRNPPNTLPLVGNGIVFLRPRQALFSWFSRCERLFGYETLHISVPSLPPGVIISDPRNLDFVFKNEGIFEKGAFFKDRSWDLFGHGIINVDGDLWRLQRRAGLQFLSKANLKVLTERALPEYVKQSIDNLGKAADVGQIADLQGVIHEVTTQLMGRMAYNMEMHADDDFTLAFEYASGKTAERFQNPLWFITELITGSKLRRTLATVKDYGQRIVSSAVADRNTEKDGGKDKLDAISGSLIQSLLDSIGDENLVADAALNYLSAGRDTVAQALTWTFYLLIKNPSVTAKLCTAIEKLEDPESPETLTPINLPYAVAVFYESLRLYPPIPFEIKQAQHATTLPDGTFLPQSSIVIWCAWAMNRSYKTWGPDADEFRPERWLDDDGAVMKRSAAEFPVFNGGPRLCLGKNMAEVMAVQVVSKFVMQFDFTAAFEGERVSKSSLTLPMEGGLPVHVRWRSEKKALRDNV
ncbi:Fc.00g038610.m01.CDS01 [Cosmosporella sp. VM-42]